MAGHRPRPSRKMRKRSLAQVGVTAFAAATAACTASSLSSSLGLPQRQQHLQQQQHLVPPAARQVPYQNSHPDRKRHLVQFWIPPPHGASHETTESETEFGPLDQQLRRQLPANSPTGSTTTATATTEEAAVTQRSIDYDYGNDDDGHAHVLGDAGQEDVDLVFRALRRHNNHRKEAESVDGTPSTSSSSLWSLWPESWNSWFSARRRTAERTSSASFSSASSSSSSSPGFVNANQTSTGHRDYSYPSFNVSAGTEYGSVDTAAASSSNGTNATNNGNRAGGTAIPAMASDSVTAVYTDSELTSTTVGTTDNNNSTNSTTNSSSTFNGTSTTGAVNDTSSNLLPPSLPRYRPIRIRAYLSENGGAGQFLTNIEHRQLLQDMVRPALLSWSAALRVDPVHGNLTVDQTQLVDGATCGPGRESGLPSVPVPPTHFTYGIANTDLVVYLSLGFVTDANRTARSIVEGTGGAWNARPTTTHNATVAPSSAASPTVGANTGGNAPRASPSSPEDAAAPTMHPSSKNRSWTDAAQWRNVSNGTQASTPPPPRCRGDYLAASAICSTDQYDRPIAAILHICIDETFFHESSLLRNLATLRHELGHTLGFNSMSLAHFRHPDGSPRTPRVNGSIPLTEIECTGPVNERKRAQVALPSNDTLRFRTVRGGVRVAEIVTPSVAQVVRNHFDCQDLPGAELESGEFLPLATDALETSCIGDHWERRLFKTDLLNPIVDESNSGGPRISTLNLAYFADSGWYQVDLSRAASPPGWGRAAGCDFVDQPCINAEGQVPVPFQDTFCNERPAVDADGFATDLSGCTPDLTKKAACSIERYDGALPSAYQYFNGTYGSNVGGRDPLMDYCPVFSGFANGLCSDADNEALVQVDKIERFGDRNSRCIPGLVSSRRTALCLRIACVVEDRSFHVQVDGVWTACSYKGQVLDTSGGDRVYCPDPIRVCPTFYCQTDCLGTDFLCNYAAGRCTCARNCTDDDAAADEAPFYDPSLLNTTSSSSLPDEDSPLSDYYVPTSRMLTNENRRFALDDKSIVAIALGCVALVGLLFLACGCRRCWRSDDGAHTTSPDDEEGGADDAIVTAAASSSTNPNKDKMLAAVVLDLRMNDPTRRGTDAVGDRASETDVSFTDTDGGGTYATDLSGDFHSHTLGGPDVAVFGGGGGGGADDGYTDPLARPMVVRRRNIRDALFR